MRQGTPGEAECFDGDFGNDHPCERMLSRIKEDYWDVLGTWPDVDWSKRPYWQIFYDETAPVGFDTVEEVFQ
jgi:hypothetical protein